MADIYSEVIEKLKVDVGAKFRILVLTDINGVLCFRDKAENKPVDEYGNTNPNFTLLNRRIVYYRPGARDFIRKIKSHPRVIFGLVTFAMAKNLKGDKLL